jgi:DNA ligase-1
MSYLNLKPVEFDAMGKRNQQQFRWDGRILLPKYDGCFAMVAFWDGKLDYIMSRTGEVVKSMDHIGEDLLTRYPGLAKSKAGWMVLGEAWNPGKEFADLSGEFRRQRPQPQLGFAPFDLVHYRHDNDADLPTLWSTTPYRERLALLEAANARQVACNVFPPVPVTCEGKDHAERYARCLKDMGGYDGAVCADPDATYTPGAGKAGEFIKVKPLVSYSLECVGYEADVGAKTGRATGCLIVRFKGGNCGVATGLSEAQQANLQQFVGKIIEVEAMGVSSKGLLREPRFKGVRTDVKQADY